MIGSQWIRSVLTHCNVLNQQKEKQFNQRVFSESVLSPLNMLFVPEL